VQLQLLVMFRKNKPYAVFILYNLKEPRLATFWSSGDRNDCGRGRCSRAGVGSMLSPLR